MTPAEARAVACDFLRQAGDETGARALEWTHELVCYPRMVVADFPFTIYDRRRAFDFYAYLNPAWLADEVERAHEEALRVHADALAAEFFGHAAG